MEGGGKGREMEEREREGGSEEGWDREYGKDTLNPRPFWPRPEGSGV